jgi:glutamate dehydrogenase/leucine dehydrogenase
VKTAKAKKVMAHIHRGKAYPVFEVDASDLWRHVNDKDSTKGSKTAAVLPGVITNAGGLPLGDFEWVRDFSSFFWSEEDIYTRLVRILRAAFAGSCQVADRRHVACAPPPSPWRVRASCKQGNCANFSPENSRCQKTGSASK